MSLEEDVMVGGVGGEGVSGEEGRVVRVVRVEVVDDSVLEDGEWFVVQVSVLTQQAGVEITSGNTTVYITNDDSEKHIHYLLYMCN